MEHFEWDDRLLIIIMEFVPGGDLGKLISDQGALNEDVVRIMSNQLLSALGYLHENNITHRDVKPDNILINSLQPIDLKLTDFGLSKMVDSEQTFLRTFCGTLLYCAPEVYTEYAEYDESGMRSRGKKARRMPGQRYNHAVDIWSLGGVLFYTLTKSPPYPVKSGISYSELLHKIMTTRLNIGPLQSYDVSEQAIDFLCRMLQRRPENRATVSELERHPWSAGTDSTIDASQSFDEITDDDDILDNFSQLQPQHYEEDRISDSMGEESEKENDSIFRPGQNRLFGEVGVSAIGSSGVIPEDFLNLQTSNPSAGETEILAQNVDEAYQSEESNTPVTRNRRAYHHTVASLAQNQSEDQLQSLVEDVASQSLGGNESVVQNMNSSHYSLQSMDFNTSKRKPPLYDTSDEFDENTPPRKPTMKRLKSEGNIETLANGIIEEYKILAQIPQIRRLGSGRQIDGPYDKMMFWEQDRSTWHLDYPEMTQLQHDAFAQAARDRGEEFSRGKSYLWDLAMKYFPPVSRTQTGNGQVHLTPRTASRAGDSSIVDMPVDFPPTALPDASLDIPDTLPAPTPIVVPVQDQAPEKRVVGIFESHPDSCLQSISIPVTDSLVSFGRGLENTEIFQPRSDARVPKSAWKLLLWKDGDGFDPAKDPAKYPSPWLRNNDDPHSYAFYISTKATSGININGYFLAPSDGKNPNSPSRHWARLYNGDSVRIWGTDGPGNQTKLTFKCFWGASSQNRGDDKRLVPADAALAQKLDTACQKTEKRIREAVEKQKKMNEAYENQAERKALVARERERSRVFEMKRQEATGYLQSRQLQGSRRGSRASAPPTSRGHTAQIS